ncbi:hypothetical protein V8057_004376 [Vibrio vulnificus]
MKIFTVFIGLSLAVFIGYLFFIGNIAIAIILLMAGLILIPVVKMFGNGGINVTAAPDQKSYGETHKGSGSSGM